MTYQPRILDSELSDLISGLPAVCLVGPKAVGKTTTASRLARNIVRMDEPAVAELVSADPKRLLHGEEPILIDEWQRFPASWDMVRRAIDDDARPSRYLLTGSAPPISAAMHSGAGRIVTLRMRPMSLAERVLDTPTVRLCDLLSGQRQAIEGSTSVGLEQYVHEIVSSGFPAIRRLSGRLLRTQLDGYLDSIIERDFDEAGQRVRNRSALRRWLTAYAAATSTTASFESIRDAASSGESNKPSKSAVAPYRATLEALWMTDEVGAWLPGTNRLRRLGASPVHQLADPALAARLLGLDSEALLEARPATAGDLRGKVSTGMLFESLVTMSVQTYAQANEARLFHLRTRAGEHEIDLIIERSDGGIVALEIKLKATVADDDVRHLRWLADRLGPNLLDSAVITTGSDAYRRRDGIAVIPAALLTA